MDDVETASPDNWKGEVEGEKRVCVGVGRVFGPYVVKST